MRPGTHLIIWRYIKILTSIRNVQTLYIILLINCMMHIADLPNVLYEVSFPNVKAATCRPSLMLLWLQIILNSVLCWPNRPATELTSGQIVPRPNRSYTWEVCLSVCLDGVFLNVSTTYARSGSGYVVPNACAKAGVEALTKYTLSLCCFLYCFYHFHCYCYYYFIPLVTMIPRFFLNLKNNSVTLWSSVRAVGSWQAVV